MTIARAFAKGSHTEKRKAARTRLILKGRILFPDRGQEDSCEVLDISPAGAGLKCAAFAPTGARIVLYVDGFGRFAGTVSRRDRMRMGVAFDSSPARRARTTEQISAFIANGMKVGEGMRKTVRLSGEHEVHEIVTAHGARLSCEVIDIAIGGVAVRSQNRPPVGETVYFGESGGPVLRHTEDGFVVQFLAAAGRAGATSGAAHSTVR